MPWLSPCRQLYRIQSPIGHRTRPIQALLCVVLFGMLCSFHRCARLTDAGSRATADVFPVRRRVEQNVFTVDADAEVQWAAPIKPACRYREGTTSVDCVGSVVCLRPAGERSSRNVHLTPCVVEGFGHWTHLLLNGELPPGDRHLIDRAGAFMPIYHRLVDVSVECGRLVRCLRVARACKQEFVVRSLDRQWFGGARRARTG